MSACVNVCTRLAALSWLLPRNSATRASWAALQVGALIAIYFALRRMPRGPAPPSEREHRWLYLVTLVILARLVLRDTHGGGGNILNVAMCVMAFADAERGQHARAGWWLGFSVVTKPTQILLLPLLWCQGHRQTVLQALGAGAALIVLSIALLRLDLQPWVLWLDGTLALAQQADAFAPPALQWPAFEWMNQSLRCAIARWFGDVPPELADRVRWGVGHGLGWSAAACAWITRIVTASLLGLVLLRAYVSSVRSTALVEPETAAARRTSQFAATLTLSLLASPISWKAHHVALLPIVYLVLAAASRQRSSKLASVVAAWFLCCGIGKELLGNDGDEWFNSLYILTAFDLVLIAVALRLRWRSP